jgi:hypothetical protein
MVDDGAGGSALLKEQPDHRRTRAVAAMGRTFTREIVPRKTEKVSAVERWISR